MALSISGNLIIDEESRNPSTGTNTENEVATLSADQALIDYLNGLNANPDDGFPQYAERDDMIGGFANGATLSLVSCRSHKHRSCLAARPKKFQNSLRACLRFRLGADPLNFELSSFFSA